MPGFSHGGNMHTILSWGMGVESTAILVRWLLDPETRPCTGSGSRRLTAIAIWKRTALWCCR